MGARSRLLPSTPQRSTKFRHGYAGTIYKGQGRTLDQTYLYHSEHWRSAATYVALTRHRDKAELFVATNTAADVQQLARQMARVEERRAASQFHHQGDDGPLRPLTAREIAERFSEPARRRSGASDTGGQQQGSIPSQRLDEARARAAGVRAQADREQTFDRQHDADRSR